MTQADTLGTVADRPTATASGVRWFQLLLGFIIMMTISSPQYVWTLFTGAFQQSTGALLSDVQWTITILIVIQTWLSPVQGWLVDRFGPKLLIGFGALLSGLGWVAASFATSLMGLYATYGLICGIGTGIVYIGIVGLMVKWFPDRRGFATGVVAAGYGFGAILTTFPIDSMVKASGVPATLLTFGAIFAAVGFVAALLLRAPRNGEVASPVLMDGVATGRHYTPGEMLKTPVFWLMFVMFTMMSTGGLMVLTQFTSFAKAFGIDAKTMVTIGGMTLAAIPTALTFDRVTNGLTRPFFGWGEIFSLFPSTLTDTFGSKHATTNYGFLYMAQGIGSILGAPVAAKIFEATGSWLNVFGIVIGMDILTGLLALFVLRGMRRRFMA